MTHDPDRIVVLSAEDLDTILDALSALAFGMAHPSPEDRTRSASIVESFVQHLAAKHDLPGEMTR